MRKIALLMLLLPLLTVAQTIKPGDKFFDGKYLYVAEPDGNGGDMIMKGMDISGHQQEYGLMKGKQAGEYTLAQVDGNDPMPYGCVWGSRVQYIRQDGMNFLAFYPEEHSIGQTAVLTTDNITDCTLQQKRAVDDNDGKQLCHNWLMNQDYLSNFRNGAYELMLEELQGVTQKSLVERVNQQVIAYCNAVGMGEAGDDEFPEEKEILVSNTEEFLLALGSNRVITLMPGTVLNLSACLNDASMFESEKYVWAAEGYSRAFGGPEAVVSVDCYDGRQLELVNIRNLTIRGSKDCSIIVEPRYANVLSFYNCWEIMLENLTLGHTEEGSCMGGVVKMENCINTIIRHCDLYGCGIYGIQADDCQDLYVRNSVIRDCSDGVMELHGVTEAVFTDCDFIRCRDFTMVTVDSRCSGVVFNGCRFAQNKGRLFDISSAVEVTSCEIHHATGQDLGNVSSKMFVYGDDGTRWYRDNEPLSPRAVGPDTE